VNITRCLDTIEAVGLRAISRTNKKSDHTTIGIRKRTIEVQNNGLEEN